MSMYGYNDTETEQIGSGLSFGLNASCVRMVKFQWVNDAGSNSSEGEALDIHFQIDDADRVEKLRLFPIVKAFDDKGNETTDPESKAFKKAVDNLNRMITHVMHVFVDINVLKQALSVNISSFKEFCKINEALLPKDYSEIKLDLFAEYQWTPKGEYKKTFLQIPRKMSHGRWLAKAIKPVGEWKEMIKPNIKESDTTALKYVDDAGNVHPFKRSGWYMLSNYANQINNSEPDVPEEEVPEEEQADAFKTEPSNSNIENDGTQWDEIANK